MKLIPRAARRGFSLLEIVIAVCVMAILAGVLVIRSGGILSSSKVSKTASLVNTLQTACTAFHADTGTMAYEYSGSTAPNRQLSGTQSMAGWKGPYLPEPLRTSGTNPFGGVAHLYNVVTANGWITGFDTDGDGTEDVTGKGNMLYLSGMEAGDAKSLNDVFDAGLPGAWEATGKVRYVAASKIVLVLVYF
ncbi:MAG: prepilin-type N-terminal cleavage/methylation domain-containing protein [Planctomycetota bacterium]